MTIQPKKADQQRNPKLRGTTFSTLCGVQEVWTAFSLQFLPKKHSPATAALLSGMCLYLPVSFKGRGVVKGVGGIVKEPHTEDWVAWHNEVGKHSLTPTCSTGSTSVLQSAMPEHLFYKGELELIFLHSVKSWESLLTAQKDAHRHSSNRSKPTLSGIF